MSTPKPGQIRCPTCHESTPPAGFCTRCGQPIPASALARPRGLDRDELEDRLRGRREGDTPLRRGMPAAGAAASAGFDRFQPEPEDALAVREAPAPGSAAHVDNLVRSEEEQPASIESQRPAPRWPREAPQHAQAEQPADLPEPHEQGRPEYESADAQRPESAGSETPEEEEAYYDYGTEYDYDGAAPYYTDERGSGGPWLIVGILGLGLVALLGGVLLSGLFNRGPGVAAQTATPTIAAEQSSTPSAGAGESSTQAPSSEATPGAPGTFPDGFVASVQPCGSTQMNKDGCVEDGTTLDGTTVWIWAGFEKGTAQDVVGVTLVDSATDEELQDASLELSKVNCGQICNGYLKFSFSGLSAGEYTLRVSRNGTFAAEAPFSVSA